MAARVRRLVAAAVFAALALAAAPTHGANAASCLPGTEPFAEYRLFFERSQG